jgi:hypothetical protein
MAHWVLRGKMAEHNEDGHDRQERIQREQHRPEQNDGYDDAARGGPGARPTNVGTSPDTRVTREDEFDRAAREAANDVRRRDSSAG